MEIENTNPETVTENEAGSDTNSENANETLSFDDMLKSNKDYQAELDRRVAKALETAKGKWQQSLEDEKDEAKKLEKMTAAQREAYLLQKDKEAFEKQKSEFQKQQMIVAVGSELQKRGLPADFAAYLSADTAEATQQNITKFEEAFNNAVAKTVKSRMRGDKPPKETKPNSAEEDPFLKGFSAK